MSKINWLSNFFSRKESQTRIVNSVRQLGQPVSTPANFMGFTREGYQKNAIVYTCVQKIATACAGIDWDVYNKRKGGTPQELEEHPLDVLLDRPNPLQARAAFIENVVAYRMLTGNSYINSVGPKSGPPMELWPVNPNFMKVVPGPNGYPSKYIYDVGGNKVEFLVDFVKMKSPILHLKTFHPNNDHYGMSPIEAAMLQLDQANAGAKWNLALLQNSATPSGVLQMKISDSNPRGEMTGEQYKRIKDEFESGHQGSHNAGRPLILEGGLAWQQISLAPKDVEFIKGREMNASDLCMVFGVPGEMLGLGKKTYSNYGEARESFYEETVLPLMDYVRDELNMWLCPMFGDKVMLDYDKDDIEALAPKRERKFTAIAGANWLTQNEKREATGYEPAEGLDVYVIGTQIIDPLNMPDPNAVDPNAPVDPNNPNDPNADPNQGDPNADPQAAAQDENGPTGKGPKKKPKADSQAAGKGDDGDDREWKSINLINQNEKLTSWKKQNLRREKLEKAFARDLSHDLKGLADALKNSVKDVSDPKVMEFALTKAAGEHMPLIANTIKRHITYTLHDFGSMMFDEAKSKLGTLETKSTRKYQGFIDAYATKRTGQAITHIEGTTKKTVQRVVRNLVDQNIQSGDTNHDLAADIGSYFDEISDARAMTIARTEVSMASSQGSLEAVKTLQIPGMVKEWVTANDDRVRDGGKHGNDADHGAMNGAEMPLDEKFGVPPDCLMDGPGDESAPADQVINCRCVLVYKNNA